MKRPLMLSVRGRSGAEFVFLFDGDLAHLDEWRAEGLDVGEVQYVIPAWVVSLGLQGAYVRLVDVWRLLWR